MTTWADGTSVHRSASELEALLRAYSEIRGPTINPMNPAYSGGAVGNGSTDDTIQIQAALTALGSDGGMMLVPGGRTYMVPNGGLGVGQAAAKIVGAAGSYSLQGTVWKMTATTGILLNASGPGFAMDGMNIYGLYLGTHLAGKIGLKLTASNYSRIENCQFSSFYDCITIDTSGFLSIDRCSMNEFVEAGVLVQNTVSPDFLNSSISNCSFSRADLASGGSAILYKTGGGLRVENCSLEGGLAARAFDYGIQVAIPTAKTFSLLIVTGNSIEQFNIAAVGIAATGTGKISNSVIIEGNEMNALNAVASTGVLIDSSITSVPSVNINGNNIVLVNTGIDIANTKVVTIDGNTIWAAITTGIRIRAGCSNVHLGTNAIDMVLGGRAVVWDDPLNVGLPEYETSIPFSFADGSLHNLFEVGLIPNAACEVEITLSGQNVAGGQFHHRYIRTYSSNAQQTDVSAPGTVGTDYTGVGSGNITPTWTVAGLGAGVTPTTLGGPVQFGVTRGTGTTFKGHCKVRVFGGGFAYFKPLIREAFQ